MNLQNDAVLDHLAAEMRWWLEHGVDGFRLDAVQCLGYDPALRDNPPRAPHEAPVLVGGGPGNPFRDQIHVFDRNAEGIVLVVDTDHRLLGTVTDGDIRRAILDNMDLGLPAQVLLERRVSGPHQAPSTAPVGTPDAWQDAAKA